ncbi:transcriptional regulator [Ruegeria sp. ANG-S4]|uniref:helix-turn-helix transcriptional regulator n=1 Tax=Ruegeria sp. ANG-S4 TaxID=1577904 RepID=UPI00057E894B|nr:helix-turn-helix transcriptional regulator [Ruegeria sp. ANG-S4]KIC40987.1 transcriptional regulator [Ruegeria sp. ANG-S4]
MKELTPSETALNPQGGDGPTELAARVGHRVRAARKEHGISRRVLSERSGVSPRYLAQLEAGEGNISIGLLQRVAQALDSKIEALITENAYSDPKALQVAELFQRADKKTRESVLQLLRADPTNPSRAGRICLIGLRGAGKSTLGAMAANALNLPFVELTRVIEGMAGMPLPDIMAFYGQEGYRKLEAQALDRVVDEHDRLVLAVAGGIVAEPDTYATLLRRFHTIWLRATPQEHMDRVRAQGDERPMQGNPAAMDQLKSILANREDQYARASAQLDTSGHQVVDSLQDVLSLIRNNHYLD